MALQQVEKTIQEKVSDPTAPAEEASELKKTALDHCTSMLDCLEAIDSILPSGPVFSVEEEQALRLSASLENAETTSHVHVEETQLDTARLNELMSHSTVFGHARLDILVPDPAVLAWVLRGHMQIRSTCCNASGIV